MASTPERLPQHTGHEGSGRTTSGGANPYADAARTRKAHAIAETLDAAGADADEAQRLSTEERILTAQIAGMKPASAETWDQAVGILRARLETRARYAGDPFEGIGTRAS